MMQTSLALFLFIATGGFQVANAQIDNPNFRICGLNYTDVVANCNTNPTCPTGDNCPVGYQCFQLSEQLCPPETTAPTPEPTVAPTPTPEPTPTPKFQVCAASFQEATTLCFDTTKNCATCNNITEACFQISPEQCTEPVTTESPTASPTVTPTVAPKPTPSPTMSLAPTKAPTPNRYFCASGWDTVDEDCSTLTPCPNGQQDCAGAGAGMNCYQIQAAQCGSSARPVDTISAGGNVNVQIVPQTAKPTEAPTATPTAKPTEVPTATPTVAPTVASKPTPSPSSVAPTAAPTPNRFFCASGWDTVDENCSTATPCPKGQWDCNGLDGMNCYQIQADKCPGLIDQDDTDSSETEGEGSADDTGSSETEGEGAGAQLSAPSVSEEKVRVCAKDIIEAFFNCVTNTPCPDGAVGSCGTGEACFELDSCGTSSSTTGDSNSASMTGVSNSTSMAGYSADESNYSFGTAVPVPSPSGENEISDPPTLRPTQGFEFSWTTPSPNGSNIQQISFVLKSFLVGVSVVGAALAML